MANETRDKGIKTEGLTGSELQQSQSGGGSGLFGGNRDQRQGGEARPSDMSEAGGSSGAGGYGSAQNQQSHQGQQQAPGGGADPGQSRGERFDEEQGGGRGGDSLGTGAGEAGPDSTSEWDQQQGVRGGKEVSELQRDQQEHQDRGQGSIGADEEER